MKSFSQESWDPEVPALKREEPRSLGQSGNIMRSLKKQTVEDPKCSPFKLTSGWRC